MHTIINKVVTVMLAVFNRTVLAPLRARKKFQPIFEKLFLLGIYGMNYGRHGGVHESGEMAALREVKSKLQSAKPKLTLFDIGAHTGEYSLLLAKVFSGKEIEIFAFEPSLNSYERLIENTNHISKIKSFNIGLSDTPGQGYLLNSGSKAAQIVKSQQNNRDGEPTRLTTLDEFCNGRTISSIHFLKIDAEGHEYQILAGAKNLIENNSIKFIQFEFGYASVTSSSGKYFSDYFDLLKYKYRIYRIMKDGLLEIKKEKTAMNEIYFGGNFIAELRE